MRHDLSPDAMRYAIMVSRTGSFTLAAQVFGMAQPTLSLAVRKLEKQLGAEMFTRTSYGTTMTPFGERVIPLMQRALDALSDAATEGKRWLNEQKRFLRIGVSDLIGGDVIGRLYAAIRELPERHDLAIIEGSMESLRSRLRKSNFDLIIGPGAGRCGGLVSRRVISEPIAVVKMRPGRREMIEFNEIAQRNFIMPNPDNGLGDFIQTFFQERLFKLNTYFDEADSLRRMEEWAREGKGIALIPQSMINPEEYKCPLLKDNGRLVEITHEVAWRPDTRLAPVLEYVVSRLIERRL
ncbi:LysR family transcriptional regulator [Actinobaculum suis]|uniref:LysR family transcriptional regulator n=1 Tax=Actinobaculum suis TaxID=1657 RepID=UPI00066FD7CD|nr:LysR family transcriptional regulator [Actinobaculum suis]KMY24076.1 hypothetical protein ACU19_00845 [Actinobaculum suis]OCA95689.1 hypothetical protein ACU20_00545 [Actinobaculum suis]OCA95891.1 hypothetical protein ACU21_00545 [Actinobaculum suis]